MKRLPPRLRLTDKDRLLAELVREGADVKRILKRTGLTYRQYKHKLRKLQALGLL